MTAGRRTTLGAMTSLRLLTALLLLAGCAPAAPHASSWRAERGVVYCYRTLADADCSRQPEAGAAPRLIAAGPEIFFRPAGVSTSGEASRRR
jgi:hypothetical protein